VCYRLSWIRQNFCRSRRGAGGETDRGKRRLGMLWSNTLRLTRDRKKWLIVRYMLWQYLSFLYFDFLTGIWSLGWIMV